MTRANLSRKNAFSEPRPNGQALLELSLIVCLCFVFAGSPPPAVNETHYLAKAKHYWNPAWCQGDFFLESADAHTVFYWMFGWTTLLVPLPAVAWIGRVFVWILLALSWRSLVRKLTPVTWSPLWAAILLLPLTYYGHLSGEWLVGGIEAKGFAYPLVIWAIGSAVERQWWRVWPLLGLASSFHILVGGWAVIACLLAWFWRRQEDQLSLVDLVIWLFVGGLCALPGLVPAVQLSGQATAAELQEASRIYTFRRLAHHLVFQRFPWGNMLRFGVLVLAWWYVSNRVAPTDRLLRLQTIVRGSLLITATGIAIDFLTGPFLDVRALLLRYYWFRLSDVFVPLGLAISIVTLRGSPRRKETDWLLAGSFLAAAIGIGWGMGENGFAARSAGLQQQHWPAISDRGLDAEQIDADWREACHWVRKHPDVVPRNTIFLAPTRQQTFKWFAGRAEVVTWKDVPQDATGLIAWWQRRQDVYLLGDWPWQEYEKLANLIDRYGVTHVIWPRPPEDVPSPEATLLFGNDSFVIYELALMAIPDQ